MMALLAFYALNSTAFFVFLPAGRDIVSWPTPLLPGEELSRPAMDATSKALRPFTWGVWGLNHCMMSFLKIYANMNGDRQLLQILSVQTVVCLLYLVLTHQTNMTAKADLSGFRNLFVVEALAILYLAFFA